MLMFLYAIYDKLAQECGPVFEAKNDLTAARGFFQSIPPVAKASEFSLLCVGSFSHDPVKITGFEIPREVDLPSNPNTLPFPAQEEV